MTDQEILTDLLASEKKLTGNYDSFASECVCTQLRDEFLKIFNEGHRAQTELFQEAHSRGWYQTEQAEQTKIQQAYNKLSAS